MHVAVVCKYKSIFEKKYFENYFILYFENTL